MWAAQTALCVCLTKLDCKTIPVPSRARRVEWARGSGGGGGGGDGVIGERDCESERI